jgi:NAD(P)H-nitrite reductase large subunit
MWTDSYLIKKLPQAKLTESMDSEDLTKNWLQQNEKVCICRAIPRKRFIEAINKGALTLSEINAVVGSGTGDCKGERCGPKIKKLLASYPAADLKK